MRCGIDENETRRPVMPFQMLSAPEPGAYQKMSSVPWPSFDVKSPTKGL